jgi:hypothetical protein
MPRIPPIKAPEAGQITLSFSGPCRRPGPRVATPSLHPTVPQIPSSVPQSGGPNKSAIVREFQAIAASSSFTNEADSDTETGPI